ncbi:hypothetical protein IKD57_01155 [Candidatus Saccharibacteria bacterium]|nr:hypothetical protein [Candidatus Saccharibacteria bacterium]
MNTGAGNKVIRTGDVFAGGPPNQRIWGKAKTAGPVRGYVKLSEAVGAFNFVFKDKIVLDIGSSTGGFTEYALNHGAKRVIAVEKGSHQMKAPLRFDPRIELHEKQDIFDFKLSKEINVVVADVSFLSLTKVLEYLKYNLPNREADMLMMLKPQFEAREDQLTKGIVKNEKIRRDIIKNFEQWLKQNDFLIIKKRDNATHGRHGNIERFYHLCFSRNRL